MTYGGNESGSLTASLRRFFITPSIAARTGPVSSVSLSAFIILISWIVSPTNFIISSRPSSASFLPVSISSISFLITSACAAYSSDLPSPSALPLFTPISSVKISKSFFMNSTISSDLSLISSALSFKIAKSLSHLSLCWPLIVWSCSALVIISVRDKTLVI